MKNKTSKNVGGFTLTELMVTLSIIAILAAFAAPSFNDMRKGRQLVAQSMEFASSLSYARAEATARAIHVVMCASDDGANCSGNNTWNNGWIIFADKDENGVAEDGDMLKVEGAMNGNVTLEADASEIIYTYSGDIDAAANIVFHLCPENGNSADLNQNKSRLITVNAVGSAAITVGTATCP